jgi:hypothetical protein
MMLPYHAAHRSGIWAMDEDDLPPRALREAPEQTEGFALSLGELAGGSMWLALFLAIAGGALYLLLRAAN